jgi:glycosyltransferase involved in cell wall biosynthesis
MLRRSTAQDNQVILYVGRLERYKGVQHLIRILPFMKRTVILNIVGRGPFKQGLVKLTADLKLKNRVNFEQELPRSMLLKRYIDADVFACLSDHESYGICVAEALSAGTPCVVSKTSALTEWIDDMNVFGVEHPENYEELISCLDRTMGHRVVVKHVADWDNVSKETEELYESL